MGHRAFATLSCQANQFSLSASLSSSLRGPQHTGSRGKANESVPREDRRREKTGGQQKGAALPPCLTGLCLQTMKTQREVKTKDTSQGQHWLSEPKASWDHVLVLKRTKGFLQTSDGQRYGCNWWILIWGSKKWTLVYRKSLYTPSLPPQYPDATWHRTTSRSFILPSYSPPTAEFKDPS